MSEERPYGIDWLVDYIRSISTWIRKCFDEGHIRVVNEYSIEMVGTLAVMSEEIRAFGGGQVYEEVYIEFSRGRGRKRVDVNLAELLHMFNYRKVRITIEEVVE